MASPKRNKNFKKGETASNSSNAVPNKGASKKIGAPKKSDNRRISLIVSSVIIALLTLFVYRGALDNDFVDWDDYTYVIDNDLVRSVSDIDAFKQAQKSKTQLNTNTPSAYNTSVGDIFKQIVSLNYHPLSILTMRWNNNVCPTCSEGISAKPFIKWNLILHCFNSILVLLLVYWISKRNLLASVLAALLFALHPMHVESVAWVSERKDVLYTFFFLAALLSYSKYLDLKQSKWLGFAFVLFVLSCLSKAMAVVLPLVMLLMWFWNDKSESNVASFKKTIQPKTLMHTLPFFGVALLFGLIAANVQGGGDFYGVFEVGSSTVAINDFDTFSIIQRLQFACFGFLQYLVKFFVPTDLSAFYPYPNQEVYDASLFFKAAPFIVALILGLTFYSIKFTKSIAVGIGFFVVTVILVLQFVSVGTVIMAERYTYLPYIGLAIVIALLVQEMAPQKIQKSIYLVMIGLGLLFIPTTTAQIETWQDSEALWTNVIELNKMDGNTIPQNIEQPLSTRGNYYGKRAEKARTQEEAKLYLEKAFNDFQMAAQLGSERPEVYEGMGNTYGMKGEYSKALESYSKALEYGSKRGSIYFNRGVTYSILKKPQKAIEDYNNAMKFAPEQAPQVYVNRGYTYLEMGQKEAAISDFKNALRYNPNNEMVKGYLRDLGQ
jgi:hypothetical protein